MTVYVDNMLMQASVPGVRSNARWSHLMSDDREQLIIFATRIGLRPEWIQHDDGRLDRVHFDVTATKRALAIRNGAVEIDWRKMSDLLYMLRYVQANRDLTTKFDLCNNCGQPEVLIGPWCDAANDELWLCKTCEREANS